MKAIVCDGFGGPEVLKVGERDFPKINDNEVLIKIEASACNRADTN
jgi:NADPH2:quinone reductase